MRSQSYVVTFVGMVLLIGIVASVSLGIAVAGDEEMCVPLGIITLEPPDSVEAKRAAVDFQHGRHMVLACNNCHHTWKGTAPIDGCMTTGCHDLDTLPRREVQRPSTRIRPSDTIKTHIMASASDATRR